MYVPSWLKLHQNCRIYFSDTLLIFPDTMGPDDVGLREENQDDDRGHGFFGFDHLNRVVRWAQPITYMDIYESDSFTVSSTIYLLF